MAYEYRTVEATEKSNCVPCQELVLTIHEPHQMESAIRAVFNSDREVKWNLLEPKVRTDRAGVMTVIEGRDSVGDVTKVVTLLTK